MSALNSLVGTLKVNLSKPLAKYIHNKKKRWKKNPWHFQRSIFNYLIIRGRNTQFGKDHNFESIRDYDAFKANVPIRNHEELKPYFDKVKDGHEDILWPGKPKYFCVSAGTTSGSKYLPLTSESLPNHLNATRNAILNYLYTSKKWDVLTRKMIFIQASPELDVVNGIPAGRLSGIVAHHVPAYLQQNVLPSRETNCIKDWELKIDRIAEETMNSDMGIIGGIPPWLMMYFESLLKQSKKQTVKELFPNLEVIITGGVNLKPYEEKFKTIVGEGVDLLEVYPASEGFFASQDEQPSKGLLLQVNSGIFYEFINADEIDNPDTKRYTVQDVELNVNYAIVISSVAGFWRYLIGDTIKFTSLNPHRIIVTGRTSQFISAFGEHVIAEEVESTINEAGHSLSLQIAEFTVAPQVNPPDGGLPYHEWFIEFENVPDDLGAMAKELDKLMCDKNEYYSELIKGKTMKPLVIAAIKKDGFKAAMADLGRLGGQSKALHLSNNREYANHLSKHIL